MNTVTIGVPLDYVEDNPYSKRPFYALPSKYVEALSTKGATVVGLPYQQISQVDGFLVMGGRFDIDPRLYGDHDIHPKVGPIKPNRSNFEFDVIQNAYASRKPILGICGGMQAMNVYKKGSLIQHIEPPYAAHNCSATEAIHTVTMKGSRFFENGSYHINSYHHQAVKTLGQGLVATAWSPDGLIEAFEDIDHPFFVGVQWHPEFFLDTIDHAIFEMFIEECRKSQKSSHTQEFVLVARQNNLS